MGILDSEVSSVRAKDLAIIVDLDGCLFNDSARKHLLANKDREDWSFNSSKAYDNQHMNDEPNLAIVDLIRRYCERGCTPIFLTARSAQFHNNTVKKIDSIGVSRENRVLIMRDSESENMRPSEFKELIFKREIEKDFDVLFAVDDSIEIINMWRSLGVPAFQYSNDMLFQEPSEASEAVINSCTTIAPVLAEDSLDTLADLFRQRNEVYGPSYYLHGKIMHSFFPNGITIGSDHEFAKFGVMNMMISKLSRFVNNYDTTHVDSLEDLSVYSMMMKELGMVEEERALFDENGNLKNEELDKNRKKL